MRIFLRVSLFIIFSLSFHVHPERCVNFVGENQGTHQAISQKYTSICEDKQHEDSKGLIEFSYETDDDDDENSLNFLHYNSPKNIAKNFNQQCSFNNSQFQINNAFRYSRYIHFQSFLI